MQSPTTAPQPTPSTSTAEFYCSQGIIKYCSPADTIFYLEPPPPFFSDDDDSSPSGSRVSPLMIGLITVLVAAFLLLSYYTFAYKYCKRRRRSSRWSRNQEDDELRLQTRLHQLVLQDTAAASLQFTAPPTVNSNGGLNEQFIRSITVFKYKRGDGLVESTDCAVCLTEFIEDESLRLMTNCQHAFHPPCIDTWLRSHSNCPICRASIIAAPPPPPLPIRRPPQTAVSRMRVHSGGDVVVVVDGSNRDRVRELDIRQPENATTVEVEGDVDLCAVIEKESGRGLSP